MQAINLNKKEISTNPVYKHETAYGSETLIAEDKYFIAREYDIARKMSLELTTESFTHLVVLDGSFTIEDVSLNKGETCFIPPIDQVVMVECEGKLLVTGI